MAAPFERSTPRRPASHGGQRWCEKLIACRSLLVNWQPRPFTAGHAVAHFHLGRGIDRVSIVPSKEGGSLGHIQGRIASRSVPESGQLETARDYKAAEDIIISTLAGPIAEAKRTGGRNLVGASGDHAQVAEWAIRVWADEDVASAYVAFLETRARQLVDALWYLVEALAEELLAKGVLSGAATHRLLKSVVRRKGEKARYQIPWDDLNSRGWRITAWTISFDL